MKVMILVLWSLLNTVILSKSKSRNHKHHTHIHNHHTRVHHHKKRRSLFLGALKGMAGGLAGGMLGGPGKGGGVKSPGGNAKFSAPPKWNIPSGTISPVIPIQYASFRRNKPLVIVPEIIYPNRKRQIRVHHALSIPDYYNQMAQSNNPAFISFALNNPYYRKEVNFKKNAFANSITNNTALMRVVGDHSKNFKKTLI